MQKLRHAMLATELQNIGTSDVKTTNNFMRNVKSLVHPSKISSRSIVALTCRVISLALRVGLRTL